MIQWESLQNRPNQIQNAMYHHFLWATCRGSNTDCWTLKIVGPNFEIGEGWMLWTRCRPLNRGYPMVGAPHYEHTLRCSSLLTHLVNQAVDGSVYGILILVSLVCGLSWKPRFHSLPVDTDTFFVPVFQFFVQVLCIWDGYFFFVDVRQIDELFSAFMKTWILFYFRVVYSYQ